ncbi:hypothetical protein CVV65_05220 [Kyrpidia spormannii]|uniref:Uncharacterized protein n=2 Tax=Kyrpidia spormannii TaxID=2055160 RepID=A0A2K8N524_9BACL|nr:MULTISPECIES: hypothetical protein [Kyrpidia]HHY66717.1 hypothetical protein [Alicyclobacillus sp.]ATY84428.1 hypothetical protein CVV65_05220 [Kyrpidia spormannii]MCL6575988.1 hypothetical protein [Kyrpidia sp.]CAB3391181.1 conserved protein of unknown function [Kyrpidia spormannii]CAB3392093.1 conserved protein of unknown function [Kyrpidia spormannii]
MAQRGSVDLKLGSISLVYVGARVSRGLAERFHRRCEELDCSTQETLVALIEAFIEGAGEPEDQTLSSGFPPTGDRWTPVPPPEREQWPNEEDVWAFWKDMQRTAGEEVREPRLPFVITPFQN